MIFDLDKFKQINDTLGHPEGESSCIAEILLLRLLEVFEVILFVARRGGDEFIGYSDDTLTQEVCGTERGSSLIKWPCRWEWQKKRCGLAVSIGIAFYPRQTPAACPELVKLADRALYRAKHNDGKCYMFYSEIK